MMGWGKTAKRGNVLIAGFWGLACSVTAAEAELTFTPGSVPDGQRYILVSGEFDYGQDLEAFTRLVKAHDPTFVVFHSDGGNPVKAMELGRSIRAMRLETLQLKQLECSSACALAFFGGARRYAEPGAIGVHKASFSSAADLNRDDAVSRVQELTAQTITYMIEMDIDPALLQLSLQYDSDDIRYLSKSEMQAYRVTNVMSDTLAMAPPVLPAAPLKPQTQALPDSRIAPADPRFHIPVAQTGKVRHPSGSVFLRADTSQGSPKLLELRNGIRVKVLQVDDRWYKVSVKGHLGYLHHNWVKVDQFVGGPFENRYIQIASFDNYTEAENYIRSSTLPLAAYLATNHWFAVTLPITYPPKIAAEAVKKLKADGSVPADAFMTVGNTYVSKVCCQQKTQPE
ncbi:hypothetical protein ATN84_22425 [Paramesorhizobium deserti]|uniref:SH3b domain-containing protein n=2 Tax=Paramesorhizobium deserti TaxID=1494590 RepID=A0A135HP40_9HYPH|nr:hypothetical protein ATN84_22425 [Paramesorhizobium deserti]